MPQPFQTPWDAQFTAAMQTPSMFKRAPEPSMFSPLNFDTGMGPMGNMALQLILPQLMGGFMGEHGMLPSQFMPQQNFYDQLQSQHYHQQQNIATQRASARDRASVEQTIAGLMRMTSGKPLTMQQQKQAFNMSGDVQGMLPMLSMFLGPETMDALMGSRGSATQMARSMHRGMRGARDPVTGAFGVEGRHAGLIAGEVFEELYGTREKTRQMGGISAGMAGQLFEELQARGLATAPSQYMPLESRLDEISRRTFDEGQERRMAESMLSARGLPVTEDNVTGAREDIRKTQKKIRETLDAGGAVDLSELTEMPGTEEMLSQSDATRIASRLKNLAGAVNAMRDIFGDMGRPNAPMQEIINGLDALTQGGMATMSPGRIEQMVRTSKNLAQQSGIGMQGMMALTAQAAQYGDQLGLDRSLAVRATQGTAAFSAAFKDTTRGDLPAFGALGAEQAALLDQQLRMNAQASFAGNSMAALVRMEQEGLIGRDTEAAAAAKALRSGSRTYEFGGETKTMPATMAGFRALMDRSNVDQNFAQSILNDRFQNQQYTRDFDLGGLAREAQAEVDLMPRLGNTFSGAIRQVAGGETIETLQREGLIRKGVEGQGDFRRMMTDVSRQTAERFLNLNPEVYKDPDKRNAAMQRIVKQSIENRVRAMGGDDADVAAVIKSMGGEEGLQRAGVMAMANLSRRIQYDPQLQGYKSIVGILQLHGRDTMQVARARRVEAETTAEMQSAMARFGRTGPMARIIDTIQEAPAGQAFGKTLAQAFGGIDEEELAKSKPFTAFEDTMDMFRQAERFKKRDATQAEVDARVAANRGMTVAELYKEMGDDREAFRKKHEAEFKTAREDAQRALDSRVGSLTARGEEQRRLASSVVKGLTEGGVDAVDALDDIARSLEDLPGIAGINAKLADPKLTEKQKGDLREERRQAIVKAIDARLGEKDLPKSERERLENLRSATQGLLEARKGRTMPHEARRLGIAMDQQVAGGDVKGALEIGEAAKTVPAPLAEGASEADVKRHEKDRAAAVESQRRFLEAGQAITEGLMTSTADMQQLGHKGTDMVRRLYETENEIAQMAADIGVTPAQLLAGDVDPKHADVVKRAKEKRASYVEQLGKIQEIKDLGIMPGHGKRRGDTAMGKHEAEMADTLSKFASGKLFGDKADEKGFDLKRAQVDTIVDELINMTSGGTEDKLRDSEQMRKVLAQEIGQGDRAFGMARAIVAREELTEIASEQGLIGFKGEGKDRKLVFGDEAADAERLTAEDLVKLTGTDRQKAIDALRAKGKAGKLDEATKLETENLSRQQAALEGIGRGDMSLQDLQRTIGQFSGVDRSKLAAGAAADEKRKFELSGKVRIENNEMLAVNGHVSTGGLEHNDMPTNLLAQPSQSFA